jgi:hypothetical protein
MMPTQMGWQSRALACSSYNTDRSFLLPSLCDMLQGQARPRSKRGISKLPTPLGRQAGSASAAPRPRSLAQEGEGLPRGN